MNMLKILGLNVQSPPKKRAMELLPRLVADEADVLVLSELSHSEGSRELIAALGNHGFECHWAAPEKGDYSAVIAVRGVPSKKVNWSGGVGVNRAVFVTLQAHGKVVVLSGLYVPSLNPKNMARRVDFFDALDSLLGALAARPNACVIVGGDLNCIADWHQPRIAGFTMEGFPLHKMMSRHGMLDLSERYIGPGKYSWWSPQGEGQLLDGFFIRNHFGNHVQSYGMDESFLQAGLTDHAGVRLSLQLGD